MLLAHAPGAAARAVETPCLHPARILAPGDAMAHAPGIAVGAALPAPSRHHMPVEKPYVG
jgi:hypothetical protein